jgi:hypothetical protein
VQLSILAWKLEPAVEVYEVGADSYLAENTIEAPECVTLRGPETRSVRDASEMEYDLQPSTLVVLRFQRVTHER